jgi:hypothetical protein
MTAVRFIGSRPAKAGPPDFARLRLAARFACEFAVVLLASLSSTASAARIAVLEVIVDGGADPAMRTQLTARIAEIVSRRPGIEVIAPDDIRAILEKEAEKQLLGCDDEGCLAEIGGALGADMLLQGRVSKLDEGYGLSLNLVDPSTAKALGRASEVWRGESIALLDLVKPMVDRALAAPGETLFGSIEIVGAPDGSQIYVDDQIRGTAPAGQMGNLEIGARRLRVVAEGFEAYDRSVVVEKDRVSSVTVRLVELESSPFYATWWFWTITGVGVAGGAVAAAVLLTRGGDEPGVTGVNVSVNADSAFSGGR